MAESPKQDGDALLPGGSENMSEAAVRLGAMLIEQGVLGKEQLRAALALQGGAGGFLGQALIDLGFITEAVLTPLLAKHCGIPHLNLRDYEIAPDLLEILPKPLCLKHKVIPIDKLGRNLTLALVNPLDVEGLKEVRDACPDIRIKPILCALSDFECVAARFLAPGSERAAGEDVTFVGLMAPAQAPPTEAPPPPRDRLPENDTKATMVVQQKPDMVSKGPGHYCLVCLDGWEIGREVELEEGDHVFGRSPKAKTVLTSPLVSREHARIERHGEQFILTDLGSSNGTYVNNVTVTSTALRNGDKILMGDVLFKFELQDEIEARFQQNVHRLIHYHRLTGLFTIDAFRRQLEEEIKRNKDGGPFGVAMTDLDKFKSVNDTYGHAAGSMVLSDLGELFRQTLRAQDVPAIYGGDECIILFRNIDLQGAFALAEDLRQTVAAKSFKYKDEIIRVTLSLGLAAFPAHGATVEDIIDAADKALYEAKSSGRNKVCLAQ